MPPAAHLCPAHFSVCVIYFKQQKFTNPGELLVLDGWVHRGCLHVPRSYFSLLSIAQMVLTQELPILPRPGQNLGEVFPVVWAALLTAGPGVTVCPLPHHQLIHSRVGNYLFLHSGELYQPRNSASGLLLMLVTFTFPRPKGTWHTKVIWQAPQVNGMSPRRCCFYPQPHCWSREQSSPKRGPQDTQAWLESQLSTPSRETRLLHCSKPQFPHVQNRNRKSIPFTEACGIQWDRALTSLAMWHRMYTDMAVIKILELSLTGDHPTLRFPVRN